MALQRRLCCQLWSILVSPQHLRVLRTVGQNMVPEVPSAEGALDSDNIARAGRDYLWTLLHICKSLPRGRGFHQPEKGAGRCLCYSRLDKRRTTSIEN